jgi:tetratricopeptide (TPR) repeat protein
MCYAMMACTGYSTHNKAEVAQVKKQIELLSDSGVAARKNSLFDKAIQLHNEELKLAESIGDSSSIIGALNNIGTNYRRLGLLEDACRYHMEALKLASRKNQSEKDKEARLISLNGLGNVYLTMGNYEQADSMFRLSLIGDKELDNKLGQAINLANIGSVKESLGQEDSAWIYYRYSLALNKQAQSKLGEALCFSHFGSLHEKKGMYQEAIEEYKHAYDVIEDSPDDWHKLKRASM